MLVCASPLYPSSTSVHGGYTYSHSAEVREVTQIAQGHTPVRRYNQQCSLRLELSCPMPWPFCLCEHGCKHPYREAMKILGHTYARAPKSRGPRREVGKCHTHSVHKGPQTQMHLIYECLHTFTCMHTLDTHRCVCVSV